MQVAVGLDACTSAKCELQVRQKRSAPLPPPAPRVGGFLGASSASGLCLMASARALCASSVPRGASARTRAARRPPFFAGGCSRVRESRRIPDRGQQESRRRTLQRGGAPAGGAGPDVVQGGARRAGDGGGAVGEVGAARARRAERLGAPRRGCWPPHRARRALSGAAHLARGHLRGPLCCMRGGSAWGGVERRTCRAARGAQFFAAVAACARRRRRRRR